MSSLSIKMLPKISLEEGVFRHSTLTVDIAKQQNFKPIKTLVEIYLLATLYDYDIQCVFQMQ